MNLMAAANSVTQAVNPNMVGTLKVSTGYTNVRGVANPTYDTFTPVTIQQQAVSGVGTDGPALQHLDSLGIQGTLRSFWMTGNVEAVNRVAGTSEGKGGDILITPQTLLDPPSVWLVVQMVEAFATGGWCHFIGQLQKMTVDEAMAL